MEVSAPGRICLFGEHQDYLGLPIIAMAITLRMHISGKKRKDNKVNIHLKDFGLNESFSLNDLQYLRTRDYFKSGFRTCINEGLEYSNGFDVIISSNIPIKAGVGSSSAMIVSWINFLSQMADNTIVWTQEKIGKLAYQAESLEFNEPGGMMDQYSSAIGGMIYLESDPKLSIKIMNPNIGNFVLGNSCEPKNTFEILNRCKDMRINIFEKLRKRNSNFDIHNQEKVDISFLSKGEQNIFKGTMKNRNILLKVLPELNKESPDPYSIGKYLSQHHEVLRDVLNISTPKIENMLDAALSAGALGGKITGSGGGGCMFAYAPYNPQIVAEAIERAGGKSFIISSGKGASFG